MRTQQEILNQMNQENLFISDSYTFDEYYSNLLHLQQFITQQFYENDYHETLHLDDVMTKTKELAIHYNLLNISEYLETYYMLKNLNEEIKRIVSGKKGEDYVNSLILEHVTRDDFSNYRNIYISNYEGTPEIDNVVLTKSGFFLLEIKRTKSNVHISRNGFLSTDDHGNSKYHVGNKMFLKREALKHALKQKLKEKKHSIDIDVASALVFTSNTHMDIRVNDQYKNQQWYFDNQVSNIINSCNKAVSFQYSDEQLAILNECMQELSEVKNTVTVPFDIDELKNTICSYLALIEECKDRENMETQKQVSTQMSISNDSSNKKAKLQNAMKLAGLSLATVVIATSSVLVRNHH